MVNAGGDVDVCQRRHVPAERLESNASEVHVPLQPIIQSGSTFNTYLQSILSILQHGVALRIVCPFSTHS